MEGKTGFSGVRQLKRGWVNLAAIPWILGLTGCAATDNYSRPAYKKLTEQYERGDMTHEDYMRFIHDEETWDKQQR